MFPTPIMLALEARSLIGCFQYSYLSSDNFFDAPNQRFSVFTRIWQYPQKKKKKRTCNKRGKAHIPSFLRGHQGHLTLEACESVSKLIISNLYQEVCAAHDSQRTSSTD
ncbi:hypothetical protein IscW_ISCW023784 [Ixodes scapularis]|uniref:Uncharacterized protein n=1 Tax=Ixodes scapularis TaxID=6945 RepID=B7QGN2_IXOSC|nr:hypothetical protein IscW_ISCW023784 [Ixodes scapularis]|eukprot:XP_002400085.1 hypothetical protein IscW_ISCW023784 [Ixodes scapularis]